MSDDGLPGPEARVTRFVQPGDTNFLGTLFGGVALSIMDEAASLASTRYAGSVTVTAALEQIDFHQPIRMGIAEAIARVETVGRTSMRVGVELWGEDPRTGDRHLATRGHFVMVAIDDDGRPRPVRRATPPRRVPDAEAT